jgi:hypothetical protein
MKKVWMSAALLAGLFAVVGCGQQTAQNTGGDKKGKEVAKAEPKDDGGHGWWCDEHGVAEDECSMCQKDVFKKLKPDEICPKHPDRAKAQCFICNPELREKHAAKYRAKYGKEPPEAKENMPEKK